MGFGWCWDMTGITYPAERLIRSIRSAGRDRPRVPGGRHEWGLDAEDMALTGNSVCMDTYLAATRSTSPTGVLTGMPPR